MIKRIIYVLILVALLYPIENEAQQNIVSFKLLDKNTNQPIIGTHYLFGKQVGVSNIEGKIELNLIKDLELVLSHVQYGNWKINQKELKKVFDKGIYLKEEESFNLQPITVIALHPKSGEKETYGLGVQDKLSHDGGSVLNQTPIINSIRKSGNYGFDPVLRGFKYDQLNIVIGGAQCAVAACPNRMDPPISQIAPNMMEHVEIFKGPHSLRYGSSFGGTINFVPSAPRFSNSNNIYGRISGSTESNGGIYRTEGVIGYSMENVDIGFLGSFSKGDNYEDGEGAEVLSQFQRASFGINLGIQLHKNHLLNVSGTRNLAEDVDFPALPMDLTSDKTTLLNLNHKYQINGNSLKSWSTTIYNTMVDHQMDNLAKKLNPRTVDAITDAETISYGGRTEGSWYFKSARLYAGADVRIEKAEGNRTREFVAGPKLGNVLKDNVWNGGQVGKYGMFGEYHQLFSSFNLILSGRLELNNAEAADLNEKFEINNDDIEDSQLNPSLSIGMLKNLNEKFTIGVWLGRAQRSGSITERYINSFPVGLDPYDMLGHPSLDPEINNQLDVTLSYNSNRSSVDISAFASILKDYISSEIDPSLTPTMPSSPGVRRFTNIDDAMMLGFELTWNQGLFAGLQHNLSLAYTYGKDEVKNEPLPEIAPLDFRYILKGSYMDNKVVPELSFRHVIKQSRISETFGETETPSFSLIDLKVSYQYNELIGATLGVQNLLDEAYYEHLARNVKGTPRAIYAPGRNIYFSLIVDLM